MTGLPFDTEHDGVVFTSHGGLWFISAPAGPDLTGMGDRERAILRALLGLCLRRLDEAEERL